ncbi:hypothetical protein PLESTB_000941500 [Pleodorina starrii]|uniref:Uncharacterized protein n=1 Tax=Pleodorina starrii TaxID=330485 RepID=A0A9W6F479_9CHLO|nr:hypothetical protein PLESTM_000703500 [Pleodorina starrii]GLC55081.1 hypothetical protein PLESTB_000941500 [Pleodorina starrii]GLC71162.1 hypothetical protein PLESTF_001081200 [Pleodorina starrii]
MATEADDCLVATDIAIADPSISDDDERRLQSGGLRAGAAAHGCEFALEFVMTELNSTTTCSMVVDPPEPDAKRKSERAPVMGETFISVRRFTKGDRNDPANWRWDCLDMLVRPGQKITIRGTAVPLQLLVMPAVGGAAIR